jgi:hypothetical protein
MCFPAGTAGGQKAFSRLFLRLRQAIVDVRAICSYPIESHQRA